MDSVHGLRIFTQVVETESFSKAAEKLNLSQSAISKSIKNLEEHLGVALFYRTTRQLRLTEAGLRYYQTCSKIIKELQEVEEALSIKSVQSKIKVEIPQLYGKRFILPVLMKLAERYPEVQFDVRFNNQIQDLIQEDLDLVIRIGYLDDNSSLLARRLGEQAISIVAAPAYLRKHGRPSHVDDLQNHQCLVENSQSTWLIAAMDGKIKRVQVPSRLRLQGSDACLQGALAGRGLAQVPSWLAQEAIVKKELEVILPDISPALPIHAVWIRTRQKTPKPIRILIDELLREL